MPRRIAHSGKISRVRSGKRKACRRVFPPTTVSASQLRQPWGVTGSRHIWRRLAAHHFRCIPAKRAGTRECVGRDLVGKSDQLAAAQKLIRCGRAQAVVVPLGSHGALLATPLRSQRFSTIPMPSGSGAGAGDAMVAPHEDLHAVAEAGVHAKLMLRIQ